MELKLIVEKVAKEKNGTKKEHVYDISVQGLPKEKQNVQDYKLHFVPAKGRPFSTFSGCDFASNSTYPTFLERILTDCDVRVTFSLPEEPSISTQIDIRIPN